MPEPLVHDVPDNTFTNPQLDSSVTSAKDRQKLDADFSKFWNEIDAKAAPPSAEAPSEPEPEPAPEENKQEPESPEPSEPAPPTATEEKEAPAPVPETPAPVEAKDLDSLEPHPNATPETKSQFAQLKEITKGLKETANAYRNALTPVLRELGIELSDKPEDIAKTLTEFGAQIKNWKAGAISPEVQTELQSLRELSRSVGVLQSEEFKKQFYTPMMDAYGSVIDDIAKYLNADDNFKKEYTETLKSKWNPSKIREADEGWWDTQINEMKAPETIKQMMRNRAAKVMELQEQHDRAASQLTTDQASYNKWMDSQKERFQKEYQAMVADEVRTALNTDKKDLAVWLPKDPSGILDPAKLEEVTKHNARFSLLTQEFNDIIKSFAEGPRSAARSALDFMKLRQDLPQLQKTVEEKEAAIKALTDERDKLKAEVGKRRKLIDSPLQPSAASGAPPAPTKAPAPKDGRKSLEDAYKNWEL